MLHIILIKISLFNILFYNVYYYIALFSRILNIRCKIIHYRNKENLLYILLIEHEKFSKKHNVKTKKNTSRAWEHNFNFLFFYVIRLEEVFHTEDKKYQQRRFRKFCDYRVSISLSHFLVLLWFFFCNFPLRYFV